MGIVTWDMRSYDRDGHELAQLTDATARSLQFNLNGIDQLTFTIPLHVAGEVVPTAGGGSQASTLRTLTSSVKVWRHVNDPVSGHTYDDPPELPGFAGVVGSIQDSGQANTRQVTVYSPYWRLQSRFAKETFIDRNVQSTQFMWDAIHNTNMIASGYPGGDGPGRTGIIGPDQPADFAVYGHWATPFNDPIQPRLVYERGTRLWDMIQSEITAVGIDLWPRYAFLSDHKRLAYFNTCAHLGCTPDEAQVELDYHVGANNCEDMSKTETAEPGQMANYIVGQYQGDKDSTFTVAYPKIDDAHGWARINHYGIYQYWLQDPKHADTKERLRAEIKATVVRKGLPLATYQPTISPALPPFYGRTDPLVAPGDGNRLTVGDNVKCRAARGALQIPDTELVDAGFEITSGAFAVRRVYTAQLDLDDFGFERMTLTLAPDWSTSNPLLF